MSIQLPGADTDEVQQLMALYDQLQGAAPDDAPPQLKELFDSIAQTKSGKRPAEQSDIEEIYPNPEFVVKTVDATERKVFINICSSDKIAAPGNWEGGVPEHVKEQLNHLEDVPEEGNEHLRFPLSLSEPQNDLDKQGEPCTVFDCVFATDVINGASSLRQLKVFLIETAIGWIDHKHSLGLDQRFKLPKLKYKGDTLRPQNIRREKKPLVQEIGDSPDDEPSLPLRVQPKKRPGADSATKQKQEEACTERGSSPIQGEQQFGNHLPASQEQFVASTTPAANLQGGSQLQSIRVVNVSFENRPCDHVVATLQLPHSVLHAEELQVKAGLDVLHVNAKGCAPQVVHLNIALQPSSIRCSVKGDEVVIRGDYWGVQDMLAHMEASKPLPVGAIPLQSEALLDELD